MPKYLLVFLSLFILNVAESKEVLFGGKYFASERDLANHLYFEQEYKTLVLLTLNAIENERSCNFAEPFIEVSVRVAYQLNNFNLLNFLYESSKRCNQNNQVINQIYFKYLIEIEQYEESSKLLEELDKTSNYFFILENRFLKESGKWKYLDIFSSSITKNSNINNGFTSNEIDIFGMTFEVSEDAYPVNDIGFKYSYSGTLYRYFEKESQLRLRVFLSGEDYSGSLADRRSPFFSGDYVFSKKDMISFSFGRSYWAQKRVYSMKSFSYARKLFDAGHLKMIRLSIGESKNPSSIEFSSKFIGLKGFFRIKDFHTDLDYIFNNTDYNFSSYSGYTLSAYKKIPIFSSNLIPFVEFERRNYEGNWAAYNKKRSFLRKNFGLTFTSNDFKNLKLRYSINRFNSNIPIYDNKVNTLEFEYSFY